MRIVEFRLVDEFTAEIEFDHPVSLTSPLDPLLGFVVNGTGDYSGFWATPFSIASVSERVVSISNPLSSGFGAVAIVSQPGSLTAAVPFEVAGPVVVVTGS